MKKRLLFIRSIELICFLLLSISSNSQNNAPVCPINIGFENGSFTNWQCSLGTYTDPSPGILILNTTPPVAGRHTLIQSRVPAVLDRYGHFPVTCPNGSAYSIMLGNEETNTKKAERVSYTFTVPADQDDYSIIYHYAVVFQNPNHLDYQRPKFTSKVFDVTANRYVDCGSFEFVSSGNLPGFFKSDLGNEVYYKPWSPITVKLSGYAGKTIRLEFTANDCTLGGHFGYAYLDVNENCASPISGNIYCPGVKSMALKAPYGFKEYHWYDAAFTTLLGTENILQLNQPFPAPGTVYALEIVPFPGLGCLDTIYTTIKYSPEAVNLITHSASACSSAIDITSPDITSGSSPPGLIFSYFTDATQLSYIPVPKAVTASGTYYISAVNASGCTDVKPVDILIKLPPVVKITDPYVCPPYSIDLTNKSIVEGSDPFLNYSFWRNASATIPVINPQHISAGTYYIKAVDTIGCANIMPVNASMAVPVNLKLRNAASCLSVDITADTITSDNYRKLSFTYWLNDAATLTNPSPKAITNNGIYYIKATSDSGCTDVKPLSVIVYPVPGFTVTDPTPVVYPSTINITSVLPRNNSDAIYTFWKDAATTQPQAHPGAIDTSGTYYIKAVTPYGCTAVMKVNAVIKPPLEPLYKVPNAFSPNHDGINDRFKFIALGYLQSPELKIFNRYGQLVFKTVDINNYWDGTQNGKDVLPGTYYWIFEAYDQNSRKNIVKSGMIVVLK
ncbi:MAG: hypothetical protein JWN76_1092 [Chitinophagaceae bacterium]|nr:hypothetical protein [Chitinophagaceae bacterium]